VPDAGTSAAFQPSARQGAQQIEDGYSGLERTAAAEVGRDVRVLSPPPSVGGAVPASRHGPTGVGPTGPRFFAAVRIARHIACNVQTRSSTPEPYTRGVDIGPEQVPIVIEPIEAPVPVERAPAVPATPAPVEEPVPA